MCFVCKDGDYITTAIIVFILEVSSQLYVVRCHPCFGALFDNNATHEIIELMDGIFVDCKRVQRIISCLKSIFCMDSVIMDQIYLENWNYVEMLSWIATMRSFVRYRTYAFELLESVKTNPVWPKCHVAQMSTYAASVIAKPQDIPKTIIVILRICSSFNIANNWNQFKQSKKMFTKF